MTHLSEVTNISKRRENRKERVVPWSEFEPLLNQLRLTHSTNDEAMRAIGYSGATMLSMWKNEGAPIVACNAARGVLKPQTASFSFEELADIFAALRGMLLEDPIRKSLIKKIITILDRS